MLGKEHNPTKLSKNANYGETSCLVRVLGQEKKLENKQLNSKVEYHT
jgi:hypothetical protein